jgi:ribosome-associated protein
MRKKTNNKQLKENKNLLFAVINGIQEKKGKQITIINLKEIHSSICDYFIVCHADNKKQVDAIADSVEEFVRKASDEKPITVEGKQNSEWILLDYIDVVVHVFYSETRDFYAIEDLWADAPTQVIADDEVNIRSSKIKVI